MRVAIIHDWLTTYAGAERVLEQLLLIYPQADLFCICDFLSDLDRRFLFGKTPKTTFIQRMPGANRWYRTYLPLMPFAIEQFDLTSYDLVVSSSHAIAKGVLTTPDQVHISYVHTPIRYAWDLQHQYLRETGLDRQLRGWLARYFLHKMRSWDVQAANRVDVFVANSSFVSRRIRKIYRRESEVVYPPVDTDAFVYSPVRSAVQDDYYVTASRLVPYKKIDMIVRAFKSMPNRKLMVIGDGPDRSKINMIARGCSNIDLLGYQPASLLREYLSGARAFVFAAEEDFGISPVEAQACGTPVIAYNRGGATETVAGLGAPNPTGVLYSDQTVDSLIDAIKLFEAEGQRITGAACRANAERFSVAEFRRKFALIADTALNAHNNRS